MKEIEQARQALLQIYRETGDGKYLEPIPRAIAYFRRSRLADGRLARFYELKTNKPLYFTRQYELSYSDDDMPTHYAFKVASGIDAIEREYQRLVALDRSELGRGASKVPRKATSSEADRVEAVIAAMDDQGRWVEEGRLRYHGDDDPARRVIDCRTFIRNLGLLSSYLATVPE